MRPRRAHVGDLPRVQGVLFDAGARDHLAVHKQPAIGRPLFIRRLPDGLVERALAAQRQMIAKDGVIPDRQPADGGIGMSVLSAPAGIVQNFHVSLTFPGSRRARFALFLFGAQDFCPPDLPKHPRAALEALSDFSPGSAPEDTLCETRAANARPSGNFETRFAQPVKKRADDRSGRQLAPFTCQGDLHDEEKRGLHNRFGVPAWRRSIPFTHSQGKTSPHSQRKPRTGKAILLSSGPIGLSARFVLRGAPAAPCAKRESWTFRLHIENVRIEIPRIENDRIKLILSKGVSHRAPLYSAPVLHCGSSTFPKK